MTTPDNICTVQGVGWLMANASWTQSIDTWKVFQMKATQSVIATVVAGVTGSTGNVVKPLPPFVFSEEIEKKINEA